MRDHMRLERTAPVGEETDWRCVDCGLEGPYDEVRATDCPKGQEPYPPDFPSKIVLAEVDHGRYISRFTVHRSDGYSDPGFESLLAMANDRKLEAMRRLDGVNGHWQHYSKIDNGYIGNDANLKWLLDKGIAPQTNGRGSTICCIGFCEQEQRWYGWSHRAIHGFGIGYVAKKGELPTTSGSIDEYIAEHPEEDVSVPVGFECKTLDDCKRVAIAFADSVG